MLYYFLTGFFACAFALANCLGGELLACPFTQNLFITSGTLVYPITFVINNLVTEVYGGKKAKTMVGLSFLASFIVFLFQYLFSLNYRMCGILILSSLSAFVASQLLDIRLFSMMKKWTNGKHLWLRSQLSTYSSQILDTCIANGLLLFWGLHLSKKAALSVLIGNFLYKMLFMTAAIPLLYFSVHKARRYEA